MKVGSTEKDEKAAVGSVVKFAREPCYTSDQGGADELHTTD